MGLILQSLSACEEPRNPRLQGEIFPLQSLESLPLLTGDAAKLDGKILLINFWATWCAPCREEMPYLQQLSEQLDSSRFAVIGVSIDDDANLVREFMLQYRIRFPNFQDAGSQLASDRLRLASYPQTIIVSPGGVVTGRIDRALDQGALEQALGIEIGRRSISPDFSGHLDG